MSERDLPIGVGVLVVKDGKILCGVRSDNGQICGPGGHISAGETPEEAARRETEEEFGIVPKALYEVGAMKSPEYRDSMIFLCTDYEGEPECDGKEMYGCAFLSFEEIGQLDTHPAFRDSLGLILSKIGLK